MVTLLQASCAVLAKKLGQGGLAEATFAEEGNLCILIETDKAKELYSRVGPNRK
jgi:hypothetical protein